MADYDGLALNVSTKIREDNNTEVWATRTANGGTVENRVKAGSDADRAQQLEARIDTALAANSTYLALATPTAAQTTAQTKALTRQVQALLRLRLGRLDGTD